MDLISITRKAGTQFQIGVRGHQVTSDMAVRDGGQDQGPSPVELLAGALGTCIAMIVQSYCDSHGYTDGDVGVSLTFELSDKPKRVEAIVVDVELPADVPEDRHVVIRRLAEKCPIHATLQNPPRVDLEIM